MGCGGSKSGTPAKNDEPPIADIDVPDIDPRYPTPSPPKSNKNDFYKQSDYDRIDAQVKQQILRINASSYESLAAALSAICSTDLDKLRAIFVWLFHQNIHTSFYNGVVDPYTPRGYMKLMKTGNGSYASFFTQLCRAADIPCNVIRGVGRGDSYSVGQSDVDGLDTAWCAVHVDGNWRLVHPLWAYFQEKEVFTNGVHPPPGTKRPTINEFFYLIDPNKMICFCFPTDAPWQLLKSKWDKSKFVKSPRFTEQYFTSGLMLPRKYNAIVQAENGICMIQFDHHEHVEPIVEAKVQEMENKGDKDNNDKPRTNVEAGKGGRGSVNTNKTNTPRPSQKPAAASAQIKQGRNSPMKSSPSRQGRQTPAISVTGRNDQKSPTRASSNKQEQTAPPKTTTINSQGQQPTSNNVSMSNYLITSSSSTKKTIVVKFPSKGCYILEVYGGNDTSKPKIVEFRLECGDAPKSPQPFPLLPMEGFGVLPRPASTLGISDIDPDEGIVLVKADEVKMFSFTTSQRLNLKAELLHNTATDLADFVSCQESDHDAKVKVTVPQEKVLEFGLQISARPANTTRPFTLVANFLLVDERWRKKTAVVSPRRAGNAEGIRRTLIEATQGTDTLRLETAVTDFQRQDLPDNGDLTRALDRLVELHLENLRTRTKERKLEPLDDAIESAKGSHVAKELRLSEEMKEAEAVRRQLRRLKLYMHKVLALNKATISEIHRYHRPKPLVHNVMKATFRVLGEPRNKIKEWSYIQNCMRQLGRNSMMARVQHFDPVTMKEVQAKDAQAYLDQTNKYLVRMCSAGAGTFYVWSNNMISEHQGKGKIDPVEIWQTKPVESNESVSYNTNKWTRLSQGVSIREPPLSSRQDKAGSPAGTHLDDTRSNPVSPRRGDAYNAGYSDNEEPKRRDEYNDNNFNDYDDSYNWGLNRGRYSLDERDEIFSTDDWDPNNPNSTRTNERHG